MGEVKTKGAPRQPAPLCDFSVRIYEQWEPGAYRVQVTGNRTGRTASAETGRGIQWVFALLRALKEAGAYDGRGAEGIQQASDELTRLHAEVAQLREERDEYERLIVDADDTALRQGSQYGLCDSIDNDSVAYQSAWADRQIRRARDRQVDRRALTPTGADRHA